MVKNLNVYICKCRSHIDWWLCNWACDLQRWQRIVTIPHMTTHIIFIISCLNTRDLHYQTFEHTWSLLSHVHLILNLTHCLKLEKPSFIPSCFIENKDGRIFQESSSDCNSLLLAPGYCDSPFAKDRVVSFWEGFYETVGVRLLSCLDHLKQISHRNQINKIFLSNRIQHNNSFNSIFYENITKHLKTHLFRETYPRQGTHIWVLYYIL